MTPRTKQATYVKIAKLRRLEQKGTSSRILHTVERQLKRTPEPKKQVDR